MSRWRSCSGWTRARGSPVPSAAPEHPVKVAHLHVDLPPASRGGVARQVDLLARTQVRRGHEVTVWTTAGGPADAPYQVRTVPVPGPAVTRRLWGVARAFSSLPLEGADVVHAHGDDWLLPAGTPVVRTFYGSALSEALAGRRARRVAGQLFAYAAEWRSAARADAAVGISRASVASLPWVADVVPCAVDDAFLQVEPRPADRPTVLYVAGSLGGRKRGHLVVEAVRQARRRIPDLRLVLVCPETVDEPFVEHRPGIPVEELSRLYGESWALCSGSSYEGFGIPYAEALAAGLPVVTTSNAGAREVLEDGRLGVLTSVDGLATGLVGLLHDEGRRRALGDLGREVARARYSADAVAAAYEQRYQRVRAAVRA